jgi:glycosyltransferase involved in cell wall biosynthesis
MAVQNKPILFVSPLPPPQGGIAVWTKKIFNEGLPDGTPLSLVNTRIRGKRNIFDSVILSIPEMYRTSYIIFSVLRQLLVNRPKLIHINCSLSSVGVVRDAVCMALAKIFRVPVVMHYHSNLQDFSGSRFLGASQKILRYLMRHAAANIVINTPSFEKAKSLLPNDKPPLLLPNFTEDKLFSYQKIMAQNSRPRAIFGGGITKAKGCEEILNAASELPEIDFHLYGKMHADLDGAFRGAPQNIFLHGEVNHPILINEMVKSDFLIFPSYSEGFPLTVLEAMSVSLPIIATNVGAIPEMVSENAGGYLIPTRSTDALVSAIKKLIAHPEKMLAMGAYNKQKSFAQYRYSIVITQLLNIYNKILETN